MAIIAAVLRFRAAPIGRSEAGLLAVRQNPVVTQVITRPYTTITALVTLGPGASTTLPQPNIPTPPSTSLSPDSSPAPTSTTPVVIIPGAVSSASNSLIHVQLGAILGSVLGASLLLLVIWYCLAQRRRRRDRSRAVRYVLSGSSETSSDTAEVTTMPGGGAGGGPGRMGDPWVRRGPPGIGVVPPPPRFPPTPRYTPYRQTRAPQIRGVRRYP